MKIRQLSVFLAVIKMLKKFLNKKGPKRPIFEIFDLLKNKIFLYR
jgi:hypothetical protein